MRVQQALTVNAAIQEENELSYFDRLLMVIFALASLCGAVILFLIGLLGAQGFGQTWLHVASTYPGNIYTIVIAVIWFILGLRFLFYRMGRPEDDHVVLQSDHGSIRISFETIRQLSNRTGKKVKGVQEFDTRVRGGGQAGVWLAVRVRAQADIDLNAMSKQLQTDILEYVEQTTGVAVERVTVNVAEIATTPVKANKAWVD